MLAITATAIAGKDWAPPRLLHNLVPRFASGLHPPRFLSAPLTGAGRLHPEKNDKEGLTMFSKHSHPLTNSSARIEPVRGQVADLCASVPVYAD